MCGRGGRGGGGGRRGGRGGKGGGGEDEDVGVAFYGIWECRVNEDGDEALRYLQRFGSDSLLRAAHTNMIDVTV